MNHSKKRIFLWGLILTLLIGAATVAFLWLRPKMPDAKKLLAQADSLSKQNLCLMALLEKEPENTTYQEQLLANYAALGADRLTIYALEQTYGIQAPPAAQTTPEEAGARLNRGGLAGMVEYKDSYSVAQGADTTYYATADGIYADYCGLRQKIASIGASHLISTENGLYFLNDTQRKVQYIARDGHKIQTLSLLDAQSFAFFQDQLWIIDMKGQLYCNDQPIQTARKVRSLAATPQRLYASCNDETGAAMGVLAIDSAGTQTMVISSPALAIFGGADGNLYYLNRASLPMRYDPIAKEAIILQQKEAVSISFENGEIYILNKKRNIKKIKAQ